MIVLACLGYFSSHCYGDEIVTKWLVETKQNSFMSMTCVDWLSRTDESPHRCMLCVQGLSNSLFKVGNRELHAPTTVQSNRLNLDMES